MSWQGYIDNLMATKTMTSVGIFGLDGSKWASTTDFPLGTDNIKQLIAAVSDSSKVSNGLQVGAERYIFVRNDAGFYVILKKSANGIIGFKSNQCIIIGLHDEKVKAESVVTSIGRVIDHLAKSGY